MNPKTLLKLGITLYTFIKAAIEFFDKNKDELQKVAQVVAKMYQFAAKKVIKKRLI
ncbi:hypothetical protein [Lactobacillus sp. UCMA15818]|uniref:hypothetical protein n=1 Tax=Lactobacillus sp. UCMA15818 TaxID=2583394 RepID=UPI0025B01AF8|nr:hypothetical protein [Lactobacillus sp. UCMA15818]